MTRELVRACLLAGLTPVRLAPVAQKRAVGRPRGSKDSYRRLTRRERLEAHAALMRERFGAVEDYDREMRR